MRRYIYAICACVFLLYSCRQNISDEKVRKAAARSNEINHKYIENQHEKYVKMLERKIETMDKDLTKLRGVSEQGRKGAGENIENSVQKLSVEKALLEGSLRMLHEKSADIEKQMDIHYSRYNFALDSILKDAEIFYNEYKASAE